MYQGIKMSLITKLSILLYSINVLGGSMNPSFTSKYRDLRLSLPKSCKLLITSGLRSEEKNREVGGAKNSFHLHGRAYDIITTCKDLTIKKALEGGLSVIIYKRHLHLDNRAKQVCLRKKGKGFISC